LTLDITEFKNFAENPKYDKDLVLDEVPNRESLIKILEERISKVIFSNNF
jgi:hypothetical protein